jgi:transposase InsO family protein
MRRNYAMKKKYAGFVMNELRRLKQLEEENRKLKQNEYRPHSSLDYKKPDAFAKSRLVNTAKITM